METWMTLSVLNMSYLFAKITNIKLLPIMRFTVLVIYPSNAKASFIQAQGSCKLFWKPSKPCHVCIHWKALAEYSQMITYVPGFQSFSPAFLHHFVLAKLVTTSLMVNNDYKVDFFQGIIFLLLMHSYVSVWIIMKLSNNGRIRGRKTERWGYRSDLWLWSKFMGMACKQELNHDHFAETESSPLVGCCFDLLDDLWKVGVEP